MRTDPPRWREATTDAAFLILAARISSRSAMSVLKTLVLSRNEIARESSVEALVAQSPYW